MDEQSIQRAFEAAIKNVGLGGAGSGALGGRSTGGTSAGVVDPDQLNKDLKSMAQQARDVENNIKKLNKQFLPFTGSLETARQMQNQMSQDLGRINSRLEEIDTALDKNRDGYNKISDETKKSLQAEKERITGIRRNIEIQNLASTTINNTFNGLSQASEAYQAVARTTMDAMANMSAAIQAGGSGFNLFGEAAAYTANMAKTQADMGANAMQSVGQSMQGLGLAGQLAGGALNFLATAVKHNAELRQRAAQIRNQMFMQMGDKFAQSFGAATAAGALFTNGADGMHKALKGSTITVAEFGEFVKRNNENIVASGLSFEEFTKRVGATSSAWKKSGMDSNLLKLGLSYEKQADVIANTVSQMEQLAQTSGGNKASQVELERAALSNAKNTALMAGILGQEAEERAKANKAKNEELVAQQAFAKLSQKFGVDYAQKQMEMMKTLSADERKAMQERIAFDGQLRSVELAVAEEQMGSYGEQNRAMFKGVMEGQFKNGAADVAELKKKFGPAIQKEALAMTEIASASVANVSGPITEVAKIGGRALEESLKFSADKVTSAGQAVTDGTKDDKDPSKPVDKLGSAIAEAARTMKEFQKEMEDYVVANLPTFIKANQAALNALRDAYKGEVKGLNPLAEKFAWLTEFMEKYGLVIQLAMLAVGAIVPFIALLGKMAMKAAMALKNIGGSGPGGMDMPDGPDKKGKGKIEERTYKSGKKKGQKYYVDTETGKFAKGPGAVDAASDMAKTAGKGGRMANIASKGMGVMKALGPGAITTALGMGGEMLAEHLEASGNKGAADAVGIASKAAEYAGIGMMIGTVIPGIGNVVGGAVGAAIGAGVGVWDKFGTQISDWTANTGKAVSGMWDSVSKGSSELWADTKKTVSGAYDSLTKATGSMYQSTKTFATETFATVKKNVSGAGEYVMNSIKASPLGTFSSWIGGMVSSGLDSIKGAMSSLADWAGEKFNNMASSIGNTVSNLATTASTMASNVGTSVTEGVQAAYQKAKNYMKGHTTEHMGTVEAALKKQGITDPKYIAAIKGNILKETGGRSISENMNYGGSAESVARIRKVFGSRAAKYSDEELSAMGKDPTKMGEFMYGKDTVKGQKMGNTEPGDGFKYRGRGFIQLTGKGMYMKASQAVYGDDRLVKNPDLVNNPQVAADVSAWYMKQGMGMAKSMGIDINNMSQDQANLLATSQIAGSDIRGKGAIGQEILGKVTAYSEQFTQPGATTSGPTGVAKAQIPGLKDPKGAATAEAVAKAEKGQLSQEDMKKLLADNSKFAKENAENTRMLVEQLAMLNDQSRRNTAATEKVAKRV